MHSRFAMGLFLTLWYCFINASHFINWNPFYTVFLIILIDQVLKVEIYNFSPDFLPRNPNLSVYFGQSDLTDFTG